MDKQASLSFLLTFLMGLICGVYVYFAGFAPVENSVATTVDELRDTVVIVGEAYGGCNMVQNGCPSFRVADDGTYRYFYRPQGVDQQVLREGSIPSDLRNALRIVLSEPALQAGSQTIEPAFCESYRDGIDVTYRVTFNDDEYTLDSCGTMVNGDGAMWQTLGQVWQYFETVG